MCIHLFNPPSPDCVAQMPTPCNNCHCVPRYWRLDSPAYTFEESVFDASWIVLEANPAAGSNICRWTHRADIPQGVSTGVPRERGENDFFDAIALATPLGRVWNLATRASLQLLPSPDPQLVLEEWVIYLPDIVAYTVQVELTGLISHKHFNCLSPTTFTYAISAGDTSGDPAPGNNGWPPTLTVTPYYP